MVLFGAAAWGWSIHWAHGADFQLGMGADTIPARFAAAGLAWGLGLVVIVALGVVLAVVLSSKNDPAPAPVAVNPPPPGGQGKVQDKVQGWSGGAPAEDDMTLVVARPR